MELYEAYLEEVEAHIKQKWDNRERDLIDMRVLKPWYLADWKSRTTESAAEFYRKIFTERGYCNGETHMFTQLLSEQKV